MVPAAVLLLFLAPWRLEAAAPPASTRAKPAENPWAIILASKPQAAEARALLPSLQEKKVLQWLKRAEGYPKIVESASLPGLTPGLHVLVLGVCDSREPALAARARVLPMVADAYVKQLTGPVPVACPTPISFKSKLPKGAVQLSSVPFKQERDLVLTVYKVNESAVMECKTNDLLVRLEYGSEVLEQMILEGECRGACTESAKRAGEEQVAEIRKRIETGNGSESELDYNFTECQSLTPRFLGVLGGFDKPLLFVSTPSLAHHDVVSSTPEVVGVACGDVYSSAAHEEPGALSDVESYLDRAEARPMKAPDVDRFEIGVMEKDPEGAADAPPVWKKVAELHDQGCRWNLLLP